MRIDAELVSKVARLASLSLSAEETAQLSEQLTRIVEHFEELSSADTETPPVELAAATPLRPDGAVPRGEQPWVRANAPEMAHGHFVVPRVVSRNE